MNPKGSTRQIRHGILTKNKTHAATGHGDRWLLWSVLILTGIGLLAVYESSSSIALRDFSNQFYYLQEQVKWCLIGITAMIVLSKIPYHRLIEFALPLLVATIVLLTAVFLPIIGIKAYGAHRWVNFGFINFQPAEFTKLSLIIYLAAWFTRQNTIRLSSFLLLTSFISGLIILEPDLGTAIVLLSTAFLMYFFTGAKIIQFLYILPFIIAGILVASILVPYRFNRITSFLNPESDPLGASYQIRQILIGLGSGGWTGVGIGKSRQKYAYLPEANTDSIFAIIGEEVGFIGSTFVILLFLFIVWRGFRIAQNTADPFGKLMALGITSWIGVQTTMNLASSVALMPLTGIPLPFVSYGGSNLIVLFCAVGILLNISANRKYA